MAAVVVGGEDIWATDRFCRPSAGGFGAAMDYMVATTLIGARALTSIQGCARTVWRPDHVPDRLRRLRQDKVLVGG